MRISITLLMLVVGGWCLPAKLDDDDQTENSSPLIVRDFSELQVQVSETEDGKYGLQVYQGTGSERTQVPTRAWRVPTNWKAPGRNASRVIHAELLSNGDVVVVLYSPAKGLDLIVLPLEIFQLEDDIPTPPSSFHPISFPGQPIIFPNYTVPWHPTVSSLPENWEWVSTDSEFVTPNPKRNPNPEKSSLL